MSPFLAGNLLLLVSMTATAASQVLLKGVMNRVGSERPFVELLREVGAQPALALRTGVALSLVVVGFVFWLANLSRLNLSYAYPVASSSVLLVAFLSGLFLGEAVTLRIWGGTILILLGIVLVAPAS